MIMITGRDGESWCCFQLIYVFVCVNKAESGSWDFSCSLDLHNNRPKWLPVFWQMFFCSAESANSKISSAR